MEEARVTIVRLNARINNQREEIKHKQFLLEQNDRLGSHLLDLLGIDGPQPLLVRLAIAIEAATAGETVKQGSTRSAKARAGGIAQRGPAFKKEIIGG